MVRRAREFVPQGGRLLLRYPTMLRYFCLLATQANGYTNEAISSRGFLVMSGTCTFSSG
jgi:hypothetical protein